MNIDYSQLLTKGQREQQKFARLTSEVDKEIERWLDSTAKEQNYRSIESCISYRGDPVARFSAQAQAAFEWRSAVYECASLLLKNPPSGISTAKEVLALLPQPSAFGWFNAPEVKALGDLQQDIFPEV